MKKNYNILILLIVFWLILILIYFHILNTIKLWQYDSYSITSIDDYNYQVILEKKALKNLRENNYFFYNNKKYQYKVLDSININDNTIVNIKLKAKIDLLKQIDTIIVPDTKKTILSLIIDSWR